MSNDVGSGHFFHSLSLFQEFQSRNIQTLLLLKNCDTFTYDKLNKLNIRFLIEKDKSIFSELFTEGKKNIIINDILDTEESDILFQKKLGYKIINIEDKGSGAKHAHIVINALYDKSTKNLKELNGPKYTVLRDEFILAKNNIDYAQNEDLIISFGGTDPANLSEVIYESLKISDVPFLIVEPPFRTIKIKDPRIVRNINSIANLFGHAKIGITSSGRTMYEFLYLGIPIISIAQHDREESHSLNNHELIEYLGKGSKLNSKEIYHKIISLYDDGGKLNYLRSNIEGIVDGRGLDRIVQLIINI